MASERRKSFGCLGSIVLVILGLFVFRLLHHNYDIDLFTKGHQAYLQLDCTKALDYYDKLDAWILLTYGDYQSIASQEEMECIWLQSAIKQQEANELTAAIGTYNDFVTKHTASPLVELARTRIASIFSDTRPADIINEELCTQIDELLTNDLMPQRDTNLPQLYYGCGQVYEKAANFSSGIDYYEKFLISYPNHPLAPEVNSALLQAIIARAKTGEANKLLAPEQSGTTEEGSTVVIVRNGSPESLRIVFSGTENRIEELAACNSCTTYISSPPFCPEAGPVGRYTLKPGQYFVVVESTSDKSISTWSGDWSLDSGLEYTNCFFIIKTYKFGN